MYLGEGGGLLGTVGWFDAEQVEGLLLDRGGLGEEGELVGRAGGGDDGVSREGSKVGEQGLEAVDRQAVGGGAVGLLGDGGRRALGLGDDAGAQGLSGLFVGIV